MAHLRRLGNRESNAKEIKVEVSVCVRVFCYRVPVRPLMSEHHVMLVCVRNFISLLESKYCSPFFGLCGPSKSLIDLTRFTNVVQTMTSLTHVLSIAPYMAVYSRTNQIAVFHLANQED